MRPVASVVLNTRNRASSLRRCLIALLADPSQTPREIVVVDNGSTDDTAAAIEDAAAAATIDVRYLFEPTLGVGPSINRGIRESRGDFVLHIDDDMEAKPGWADALMAGFERHTVAAVAGMTVPAWPVPLPDWLNGPHARSLALTEFGPEPRLLAPDDVPYGGNLAYRKAALPAEPIHPRLGLTGTFRRGGGEVYLIRQLRRAHEIAYTPDAVVWHHIDAERMTLDSMRRKWFQAGTGSARVHLLEGEPLHSFPRRAVRAAKTCHSAWAARRRNDRHPRSGPETNEELKAYAWAGHHIELLLTPWPRLCNWVVRRLV